MPTSEGCSLADSSSLLAPVDADSLSPSTSSTGRQPSISSGSSIASPASLHLAFKEGDMQHVDGNNSCRGLKSGLVQVCFNSTKKGTKKVYFSVLSERALELHESEKSWRRKKNAKYLVDLSSCFNVSQQTYPKLKLCVCVMTPDETIILRSLDGDQDTTDWFNRVIAALIPARALRLGRPVFNNEFFECAWDVVVAASPRLKKPVNSAGGESFPNFCLKRPDLANKPHRLCFYPHTVIVCRTGVEPSTVNLAPSGIPPYNLADFVEFPRQFVASFGRQEKYFLMRIGRTSPMGACELWAQCESEEMAVEVHARLIAIAERETEKKRKGLMASLAVAAAESGSHSEPTPVAPSANSRKQQRPEGSQPQKITSRTRKGSTRTVNIEDEAGAETRAEVRVRKTSTLTPAERQKRSLIRSYKAIVDSWEEEQNQVNQLYYEQQAARHEANNRLRRYQSIEQAIAEDIARCQMNKHLRQPAATLPSGSRPTASRRHIRSNSTSCGQAAAAAAALDGRENRERAALLPFSSAYGSHRDSLISRSSSAAEEETEDSGGTLRPTDYGSNSPHSPHSASSCAQLPCGRYMIQTQVECHHQSSLGGDDATPPGPSLLQSAAEAAAADSKAQGEYIELFSYPAATTAPGKRSAGGGAGGSAVHSLHHQHCENDYDGEEETESCGSSVACSSSLSDLASPASLAKITLPSSALPVTEAAQPTTIGRDHRRTLATMMMDDGASSMETGLESGENLSTSSSISTASRKGGGGADGCHKTTPLLEGARVVAECLCKADKASCCSSSGSTSHLTIPECTYASDSGDSCYSSMVNGQLNPRAMSFSSDMQSRMMGVLGRLVPLMEDTASPGGFAREEEDLTRPRLNTTAADGARASGVPLNRLPDTGLMSGATDTPPIRLKQQHLRQLHAPLRTKPMIEEEEESRKRTFSLGSTSAWLSKPLKKLSSSGSAIRQSNAQRVEGRSELGTAKDRMEEATALDLLLTGEEHQQQESGRRDSSESKQSRRSAASSSKSTRRRPHAAAGKAGQPRAEDSSDMVELDFDTHNGALAPAKLQNFGLQARMRINSLDQMAASSSGHHPIEARSCRSFIGNSASNSSLRGGDFPHDDGVGCCAAELQANATAADSLSSLASSMADDGGGNRLATPMSESLSVRSGGCFTDEQQPLDRRHSGGGEGATRRRRRRGEGRSTTTSSAPFSKHRSAQHPKLFEVKCFIQPTDHESLAILSSPRRVDSTSMGSIKSAAENFSGHFETIEETPSSSPSRSPSRNSTSVQRKQHSLAPESNYV